MLRLKIRLLFVLITVWKISTLKRLQDAALILVVRLRLLLV